MQKAKDAFSIKSILKTEVAPALGCTEPVAIALSSAAAASLLSNETIDVIEIWVDPNIYKNGIAVAIPGTGGLSGLDTAGAIGAIGGAPELGLEVLDPIDDGVVAKAAKILKEGKVKINLLADRQGLYVKSVVTAGRSAAECVISGSHDNIVSLKLNGRKVKNSPLLANKTQPDGKSDRSALEKWLKGLDLSALVALLDELDAEDLDFLEQGIQYNLRLAEHGLKYGSGLSIGKTMERLVRQRLMCRDMITSARILTSAASDARMAGVKLPAMSSAGSGNHGLTATLPIWAVRDYVDCEREMILKAVGLSHVITAYVKAYTGRLSAVCGCSVAAGAGAAAGIAYLLGGSLHHIAGAITNLIEDLAGVICDGAKAGCSLKLSTAAGTAVQAALFALQGVQVQSTDGIVATSPEKTMQNVGQLSTQGMVETDRTILKIMLEKRFAVD
jgi:L-cysteine desulfidase